MPSISVSTDQSTNVELHYEDVGAGRPVVLIHGWPLSGRSWEAQVPEFVDAGYRVITYDRRGFGQSSQPWDGYDYDTFAADLQSLLTELDLRDVTLVGFSMGGGEVARYVARYGTERVAAAVFASAVPPFLYQADDNPDGGLDDATIGEFEAGVKGDRIAFLDGFTTDFFTAGDRSDLVSEPFRLYQRAIAEFASPQATLRCIGAFARTDFRADLEAFSIPTLIVHGDSDGIVPFEVSGRRTHAAIPHSTVVVIEGGPHGVNATHPAEFNAAVLEFLAGATGEAHADAPVTTATAAAAGAVADDVAGRHQAAGESEPDAAATTDADTGDRPQDEPVADTAPHTTERAPEPASSPTADDNAAEPVPAAAPTPPAPSPADDSPPVEPADSGADRPLSGLTWRSAEADDPANAIVATPADKAVREGRIADPNLGDVPVDEQPHPGSL